MTWQPQGHRRIGRPKCCWDSILFCIFRRTFFRNHFWLRLFYWSVSRRTRNTKGKSPGPGCLLCLQMFTAGKSLLSSEIAAMDQDFWSSRLHQFLGFPQAVRTSRKYVPLPSTGCLIGHARLTHECMYVSVCMYVCMYVGK